MQLGALRANVFGDIDLSHVIWAAQQLGSHFIQSKSADYIWHKKLSKLQHSVRRLQIRQTKGLAPKRCKPLILLVGAAGFELATLCSQSRCATRLRYAPTKLVF